MEIIFIFLAIIFVVLIVVHIPFYKLSACHRWRCAEWISWFFVLLLAVMAGILTLNLASADYLDPTRFHSANASTISALSQNAPESLKHSNDSISSTMTAIAILVAVIALLLSLGIAWFMKELKNFDTSKAKLKDIQNKSAELEGRLAKKSEIMVDFWKTRHALLEWIEVNAKSADRWAIYNQLVVWLEMLMSEDGAVRKKAFEELIKYFPTEEEINFNEQSTRLLQPIKAYTEGCHRLHGGVSNNHVRCKIFSAAERFDWLRNEKEKDGEEFV